MFVCKQIHWFEEKRSWLKSWSEGGGWWLTGNAKWSGFTYWDEVLREFLDAADVKKIIVKSLYITLLMNYNH